MLRIYQSLRDYPCDPPAPEREGCRGPVGSLLRRFPPSHTKIETNQIYIKLGKNGDHIVYTENANNTIQVVCVSIAVSFEVGTRINNE